MNVGKGQVAVKLECHSIYRFDSDDSSLLNVGGSGQGWAAFLREKGHGNIVNSCCPPPHIQCMQSYGNKKLKSMHGDLHPAVVDALEQACMVAAHLLVERGSVPDQATGATFQGEDLPHAFENIRLVDWIDDSSISKLRIDDSGFQYLVFDVLKRLAVISMEHPLVTLTRKHVSNCPELKSTLGQMLDISSGKQNKTYEASLSILREVEKMCRPLVMGLLFDPNALVLPHSCAPVCSIGLEMNECVAIAMYEIRNSMPSVSYIDESFNHEVRTMLLELRGFTCTCERCIYEIDTGATLTIGDMRSVSRYYLSRSHFEEAERLLKTILSLETTDLDSWYALGAIELSNGRFLRAQKIWTERCSMKNDWESHEGFRLQMQKNQAYAYFKINDDENLLRKSGTSRWAEPVRNVYVTESVSVMDCNRILDLVRQTQWTTQRHYAVPTMDVPIHTIPELLKWFNKWFFQQVIPLLRGQFKTTANFYVHDAFIVRYDASASNCFLPMHTDESTHSLVLALNENFVGGGTYFSDSGKVVRLRTGQVLTFRGDSHEHGGEVVVEGTRYILTAFMYLDTPETKLKRFSDLGGTFREAKKRRDAFSFGFESAD